MFIYIHEKILYSQYKYVKLLVAENCLKPLGLG